MDRSFCPTEVYDILWEIAIIAFKPNDLDNLWRHGRMQRENKPRKRAQIGRDARGILLKCNPDLFYALHYRAREENKSLNLAVIEAVERGLNVNQQPIKP